MDFLNRFDAGRASFESAPIDPLLHCNVRLGLQLEVPFLGIVVVVTSERAVDVDRMRGMALD